MEEADLLKERLQAITDKRRIQENIALKRRQIEEEKLKLQYMKKKALKEQWLMDGLSQQSEEEQEAIRLQAQEEQQQSDELQSTILRIEKEIEALENQELNISANEEIILKRLKEVEKTAEDIIKELNADFQTDLTQHVTSPLPDVASVTLLAPAITPPICEAGDEEPKKATFAMEISVEHDKKTGRNQVVSASAVTPEMIQDKWLKVYDDGRKSVFALHQDGSNTLRTEMAEMMPSEVEELLHQATDKNVPHDVRYHQPVYSVPYAKSSRPSTPRTPNKTPTASPSPFQRAMSPRNRSQIHKGESQDLERSTNRNKTSKPSLTQEDYIPRTHRLGEEAKINYFHITGQINSGRDLIIDPQLRSENPGEATNSKEDVTHPNLVRSIKVRSDGTPAPIRPIYREVDSHYPSPGCQKYEADPDMLIERDFNSHSPFNGENNSSLNLMNTLPGELKSGPVTMMFMGYKNADDEEDEDIQAELVIIDNSDDEDDDDDDDDGEKALYLLNERDVEEGLSYHPEGYKSKVFQPKADMAKVTGSGNVIKDTYTNFDESGLHKPTFIHKAGKESPYLQGRGLDESPNTGSINMEKLKLSSMGR